MRAVGTMGTMGAMRPVGAVGAVRTVGTMGDVGARGAVGTMGAMRPVGAVGAVGAVGTVGDVYDTCIVWIRQDCIGLCLHIDSLVHRTRLLSLILGKILERSFCERRYLRGTFGKLFGHRRGTRYPNGTLKISSMSRKSSMYLQ